MRHVLGTSSLIVSSGNPKKQASNAPLWFIEGMAEHNSKSWDTEADLFLETLTSIIFCLPCNTTHSLTAIFSINMENSPLITSTIIVKARVKDPIKNNIRN